MHIPFWIRSMLCHIWITHINFNSSEEYLPELQRIQTDRQTIRMHKHFLTLLESVKNIRSRCSSVRFNMFIIYVVRLGQRYFYLVWHTYNSVIFILFSTGPFLFISFWAIWKFCLFFYLILLKNLSCFLNPCSDLCRLLISLELK